MASSLKKFFRILSGLILLGWGIVVIGIFFYILQDKQAPQKVNIVFLIFVTFVVGGLPSIFGSRLLFKSTKSRPTAQAQKPSVPLNPAAQALFDQMRAGLNAAATPKAAPTTAQKAQTPKTNKKVVDSQNYFE